MPEELVIILALLIGAIWLLVKIGQGIVAVIDGASKSYSEAAAKKKENRYLQRKGELRQYVHTLIPNELDSFEKKLGATRIEFDRAQRLTSWVARPPAWRKEEFQPLASPRKSSSCSEMRIDDIQAILNPNSDASTWFARESEIIRRQCKCPSTRPSTGNPPSSPRFRL